MNPTYEERLRSLVELSQRVGRNIPTWTQGPGGNISEKIGDIIYIKATGKRLDDVGIKARSLAGLNLAEFQRSITDALITEDEQKYSESITKYSLKQQSFGRPSMESGFHAIFPERFVCHFHSLYAILLAHKMASDSQWVAKFQRDHSYDLEYDLDSVYLIPAITPGLKICKHAALAKSKKIILLAQHGVILRLDSPNDFDIWQEFESKIAKYFPPLGRINPLPLRFRGKWKIYTPDAAIFESRIRKIVKSTSDEETILNDAAWLQDKDACEVVMSLCALNTMDATLPEFPRELRNETRELPTEIERFKQT